ncbi:helix-turn-helix transcriptional regulator [Mucilaginibacter sp.]|nr:helix-turn-helix transcriptional regulator [Mucilaginibacter sp.]MDR3694839.1 helix-turn-helix transcriptional regulator [Mucilaginibacter sp.]
METIGDLKTRTIVSNIRKIREFRNYTQDYLAAKLQISQNAYSKIE